MDSDVDIVIALASRDRWLQEHAWVGQIVGQPFSLLREQDWGPLRERRFQTASGLEVELGLVTSEWFATPVDPGTAKVLSDGCLILSDTEGLACGALSWLSLPVTGWASGDATRIAEPPAR